MTPRATTITSDDSGTGVANGGYAVDDVLTGIENLIGSDHNDYLEGDDSANVLTGGEGNDTLMGGAGADTFVFGEQDGEDVEDSILDFRSSEGDKIDLRALNLTGADLRTILAEAVTPTGVQMLVLDDDTAVNGIDKDGGTIMVTIGDQFTALTIDDFII